MRRAVLGGSLLDPLGLLTPPQSFSGFRAAETEATCQVSNHDKNISNRTTTSTLCIVAPLIFMYYNFRLKNSLKSQFEMGVMTFYKEYSD